MAQSPEYPDLRWVPPRSWTNANRTSVQLIVIHTTEGSAHGQSAEDGAAYDQRRTDGTSTHYFHDSDSTVQCVRTEDQAHTARSQGNRRGIHHELCARAAWDANQWLYTDYGRAMLDRAARQCARDVMKWNIPVRKLTPSEVAGGARGFCGHADVTAAFPADGGTHTDPGRYFPWATFLGMVRDHVESMEEDDMTPEQYRQIVREELARERPNIVKAVWTYALDVDTSAGGVNSQPAGGVLAYTSSEHHRIEDKVDAVLARLPEAPPGR